MSVGTIADVDPPIWKLIGDGLPWTAAEAQYDPAKGACPRCNDAPVLPDGAACLVCSATYTNGKRVPMRGMLAGGTGRIKHPSTKAKLKGGR